MGYQATLDESDVLEIAREFKDAKFYISTIACHGGGLGKTILDELEKDRELRDRITVFTQTKPDEISQINQTRGEKTWQVMPVLGVTTLYYLHLMKALKEGKTYGEAVIYADVEGKKTTLQNAETILDGTLITEIERLEESYRA